MMRQIILRAALWLFSLAALTALWLMSETALLLTLVLTVAFLPVVSSLLNLTLRHKVTAAAELQPTSRKMAAAQGTLRAENRGVFPAIMLAELSFFNSLTHERSKTGIRLTVPAGGKANASFTVECERCGQLRCTVERILLVDVCGILPLPAANTGAVSRMTVLPDTFAPELDLSVPMTAPDESDNYAADRAGNDLTEVFQLRDYVPGDELRRIHWKLSGKLDRLIVRDPGLPLSRSLLVLWDKTAAGDCPAADADALAEAVASVTQSLADDGCAFTLGWTEEGQLVTEDIESTDALLAAIPRLIRSREGGMSGTALLAESASETFYGRVLLFAHAVPPMLETLCSRGEVTLFLCSDTESDAPCPCIRFTARDYRTKLQNPELS